MEVRPHLRAFEKWGTCMKSILVALGVTAIVSLGVSAQKAPDFSGTWVMDISRSEAAFEASPVQAAKVVIHQGPDEIQIDTTTARNGSSPVKFKVVAEKVSEEDPSAPTFRWEGAKLVTVQDIAISGQAVSITETRSLDPTGAEMTVITELVVQHGYAGTVIVNGIDAPANSSSMKNIFVRRP
jgi:hypothetical protein